MLISIRDFINIQIFFLVLYVLDVGLSFVKILRIFEIILEFLDKIHKFHSMKIQGIDPFSKYDYSNRTKYKQTSLFILEKNHNETN